MSIKSNKVIIPNDYKEIIFNEINKSSFVNNITIVGGLDTVTIDLSNLDLSPKMSYVAEVNCECKRAEYTEIHGNVNGYFFYETLIYRIVIDKTTASKYRFFRFSLSPNVDIYNDTKIIYGGTNLNTGKPTVISRPSPMGVRMQLHVFIGDSEETFWTKIFERPLVEDDGEIESGQGLLLSGSSDLGSVFFKTFKFVFDSLVGTMTDETPDVFGSITSSLST